jgi:uncharacterized protein (TIGR01741 family)
MGFEIGLNEQYQKIAQKISDTIPDEWKEIYFQGEVSDGSGGVFFFFNTFENQEFQYCYFIPDKYGIDRKDYDNSWNELFKLTEELQNIFTENGQEPWYSIDINITEEKKLLISFDYINWNETEFGPSIRMNYFQHKYLGKPPKNDKEKETFIKIKEYEQAHSS